MGELTSMPMSRVFNGLENLEGKASNNLQTYHWDRIRHDQAFRDSVTSYWKMLYHQYPGPDYKVRIDYKKTREQIFKRFADRVSYPYGPTILNQFSSRPGYPKTFQMLIPQIADSETDVQMFLVIPGRRMKLAEVLKEMAYRQVIPVGLEETMEFMGQVWPQIRQPCRTVVALEAKQGFDRCLYFSAQYQVLAWEIDPRDGFDNQCGFLAIRDPDANVTNPPTHE